MTVHAVLADPPREGLVLTDVAATAPLSEAEAADLYAAMLADVLRAVEASGGDLLVNYRDDDALPVAGDEPSAAELRALATRALDDPDAARFEVQVGSTPAARAGNTATHLLREEGADSVALLDPRAPTIGRTDLDGAAMKLRRSEVVLGPAAGGRVSYLGLAAPIDFEGAYAPPEVETLAGRALDAGHEVDFLPTHPLVAGGADLATLVATLRARDAADRLVPPATTAAIRDLGLRVVEDDGERRVARSGADP